MPTFPRGFINYQTNLANTVLVEALCRETGRNIQTERRGRVYLQNPVDMRGIPAIGKDCPGRIHGSRPDAICDREAA